MMKQVILAATLVASGLAQANIQTVTRAVGEQVIAVSSCTSPVLGVGTGIYRSTFTKTTCVEYQTYDADVKGTFWTSTETQVGGIKNTNYRIEIKEVVGNTSYDFNSSNSGDPLIDLAREGLSAAAHITSVLSQCNNNATALKNIAVPVSQTRCAQK